MLENSAYVDFRPTLAVVITWFQSQLFAREDILVSNGGPFHCQIYFEKTKNKKKNKKKTHAGVDCLVNQGTWARDEIYFVHHQYEPGRG